MGHEDPQKKRDRENARYARETDAKKDYQRQYRATNLDRTRAKVRECKRRRLGATDATGETKAGPCEICGQHAAPLHWDHDHATGRFRGWLCSSCNQGLGRFRDSPAALLSAVAYLTRPRP